MEYGFTNKQGNTYTHYEYNISGDKIIYYATKRNFIKLLCDLMNLDKKILYKEPDEGFIIKNKGNFTVKILEKKNQNVHGSVFEKMYTPVYVRDICYKKHIGMGNVEYAYCVNDWIKQLLNKGDAKYTDVMEYYKQNGIQLFFGDDDDYFDKIFNWIIL